jgi:2-methylcitrate dehydratase PrpD
MNGTNNAASSLDLAQICQRPVPESARERAARHLLDWIACASAGATTDFGQALQSWGESEWHEDGRSHALRVGKRSVWTAILVNGSIGARSALGDIHRLSGAEPGSVVIPAALAMAQRERLTPQRLLDAIVRGYEAMIRVTAAGGAGAAHGAAAAAAACLGLDERGWCNAFQNTGTLWAGSEREAPLRALGPAAHAGALAADWARYGLGAAGAEPDAGGRLAGPGALGQAHGLDPSIEWQIFDTSIRSWPGARDTHAAIDAALSMRGHFNLEDIISITVETFNRAAHDCDVPVPATMREAHRSLQHAVAVALLYGAPRPEAFEDAALGVSQLAALRSRVRVKAAAAFEGVHPRQFGASVTLRLVGGGSRSAVVRDALGDPENPLTEAGVIEKATLLIDNGGIAQEQRDALIEAALTLPWAPTLDALNGLLP